MSIQATTKKRHVPDDPESFEQRSKRLRTDSAEFNGNSVTVIAPTTQNLNLSTFNLPPSSAMAIDDEPEENTFETREVTQVNTPANAQNMGTQPFGDIPAVFQQNAPQPAPQPQPLMALFQPQIPPLIRVDTPPLDFTSLQVMGYDNRVADEIVKFLEQNGLDIEKNKIPLGTLDSFHLGCRYFEQNNYSKARACFSQGIDNNGPDAPELNMYFHMGLSRCYFYEGNYPMAIKHANMARQFVSSGHPSDGFYLFIVGCCYAKLNNSSSAISHFIQVQPNSKVFIPAQYNVGCLFYSQNDPKWLTHFRFVKTDYPHLNWVT